uniref:Uncharacterized protein n=1 Tax=Arundo donax TaxID=35708 RepID=A0A0A9HDK4_ARUDO
MKIRKQHCQNITDARVTDGH